MDYTLWSFLKTRKLLPATPIGLATTRTIWFTGSLTAFSRKIIAKPRENGGLATGREYSPGKYADATGGP